MNHNFNHCCTRRSGRKRPTASRLATPCEPALGAGSGGDTGDGGHAHYFEGRYDLVSPEVSILAQTRHPRIQIMAVNENGGSGGQALVAAHGDKGVRITTGITPSTISTATDGVEIITELLQPILIERGLNGPNPQRIFMDPDHVLIDGNLGDVTIQSMTKITLQVADGMSSIQLTPQGITIQGLLVQIN